MNQSSLITGMLRTVGKRVWIQAFIDMGSIGIGLGAGLLFVGGLIHIFFGVIPVTLCLLLALVPPILSLVIALLFYRPSLSSSARTADCWFDGHELLTTALQLVRTSAKFRSSTATIVLTQANDAAVNWVKQLPLRCPYAVPPYNIASVILAATGLLLLSLPGIEALPHDNLIPGTVNLAGRPTTPEAIVPAASLQQQLWKVINDQTRPADAAGKSLTQGTSPVSANSRQANEQNRPGLDGDGTTAKTDNGYTGQLTEQVVNIPIDAGRSQPVTRVMAPDGSSDPTGADAAGWFSNTGNSQEALQDMDFQELSTSNLPILEYQRRTTTNPEIDKIGSIGGQLDDFKDTQDPPLKTALTPPAAEPGKLPYHSDFGPAYRRLVANYFKRINSQ